MNRIQKKKNNDNEISIMTNDLQSKKSKSQLGCYPDVEALQMSA